MRILLAGASGAVGTPLTGQLIAAERLRTTGAAAVVADVPDGENLLTAGMGRTQQAGCWRPG
jgi:uncharacterized protein YbjT (DUF2867 family)